MKRLAAQVAAIWLLTVVALQADANILVGSSFTTLTGLPLK